MLEGNLPNRNARKKPFTILKKGKKKEREGRIGGSRRWNDPARKNAIHIRIQKKKKTVDLNQKQKKI